MGVIEADLIEITYTNAKAKKQILFNDILKLRSIDNKLMSDYKKTKLDPFEVDNIKLYNVRLQEYRIFQKKLYELATKYNDHSALQYYSSNKYHYDNLIKVISDLAEYNAKVADQIHSQNDKDNNYAKLIIVCTVLLTIAISLYLGLSLANMLKRRFKNLINMADKIAKGDFTIFENVSANDEIGKTGEALNNIAINLRKLVIKLNDTINDIASGSEQMSSAADQTAQGSQQVAINISQLAAGAQQVSHNVENGAVNINNMNNIT